MGYGYSTKCRRCGYEFMAYYDVGIFFPYEYRKQMEAGRNGELGEKVRRFLNEHSDGVLDIDMTAMQCTKCGEYANSMKFNMYLPAEGKAIGEKEPVRWSVACPAEDVPYIDSRELHRNYRLAGRYLHTCERCGGRMRYVSSQSFKEGLTCPRCHVKMEETDFILWD